MKKLTLILLIYGFFLLFSPNALACVCGSDPIDTKEQLRAVVTTAFDGAAAVFSGEVIEIDRFTVKFKVGKVWKGDFHNELIMMTGTYVAENGLYKFSTCDYDFELGKKYLVFGRGSKEKLYASKCSRTSLLKKARRLVNELDRIKSKQSLSPSRAVSER